MKISNQKDIRRAALAFGKLEEKYLGQINVVKRTIDPVAPEKELVDTLEYYEGELSAARKLKEAAFQNLEIMAVHEKAAS